MISTRSWQLTGTALLVLALSGPALAATPWTPGDVVATRTLVGRLKSKDRPVVIQIGYKLLYEEGHVPGSLWAGPGEEAKGLAALKKLVAKLPRNEEVLLYCGCCPYKECANLIPAFKLMRKMGFKKLRVLELDNDFNVDWKLEGLPVETGKAAAAGHKGK